MTVPAKVSPAAMLGEVKREQNGLSSLVKMFQDNGQKSGVPLHWKKPDVTRM